MGADMLEQQPFDAQFLGGADLRGAEELERDAENARIAERRAHALCDLVRAMP